ncbi:MAG TPA: TraB/GumN family protein [Flavisolibacter sp.]|nr:TraB/GumN family protein [Flavisolibacter sp.]
MLLAFLCLLFTSVLVAQKTNKENSLLWEVTGNGLKKPSYLFGTYHFLSNGFVDTIPAIKTAYTASDAVAGELVIDSSIQQAMMEASLLGSTTLQKILPDTLYAKTAKWFKEEAGLDLINLDTFNPFTVMTVAFAITHQKYFPNKRGEVQLDTYFQELAKKDGKKIVGLETIQMQINAIFKQLTLARQVEILNETFKKKDGLKSAIAVMNDAYTRNDLNALHKLMYAGTYKREEMKPLLDDRNHYWMQQLPELMKDQSLFVAVGALHLVGETGLVQQLRKKGYTVTPINIKNQ